MVTLMAKQDNPGVNFLLVLFESRLPCPHQGEAITLFLQYCLFCDLETHQMEIGFKTSLALGLTKSKVK
jgi:hypothetical protein